MVTKKYTILGGDLRNVMLAVQLAADKLPVAVYGLSHPQLSQDVLQCCSLAEAIEYADIIIGPLPCSNNDEVLHTPLVEEKIYLTDLFRQLKRGQLFIAGYISAKIRRLADIYGISLIDYLEREELAVLNAIPTSEGAIQIAMEELPITLHGSKAMVLGFGRIGKILSKMLQGIGVHVFAAARKCHDLSWISGYGYTPVPLDRITAFLPEMDVVFNTIPHLILDDEKLSYVKKDCLLIDLASKPGGIDMEAAKARSIKTVWALSLPGKVAPLTAARYIRDTIRNILYETEA